MSTTTNIILRHKPNTKDEHKILIRVSHNGKKTDLATDHSVSKELFDNRKQKVKSKHMRSDKINYDIEQFKRKIDDVIFDLKQVDVNFDVKKIRTILNGNDPAKETTAITFSNYLNDYIQLNPDSLGVNTLGYYNTTLNRWNELFEKVKLVDVTEEHIVTLRNHLSDKYNNGINTLYNRLKTLRKMLHRAARNGLIMENPFKHVTIKQEKGSREYLSMNDVNSLSIYIPRNKSEIRVKDVFLFSVFTGLRFSDISTLTKSNFTKVPNGVRLKIKMHKTKEVLEFNLNNRAIEIYSKYKNVNSQYVFPLVEYSKDITEGEKKRRINCANAYSNKVLKEMVKRSQIDKAITFHCGRHSFATISITMGADIYVVSKVLGHTSISTTEIYAKLVDNRKQQLTDLWNGRNN